MMNTKLTGWWDNEPITRPISPEERLVSELRFHDKGGLKDKTDEEILAIANLGKELSSDKDKAKLLHHDI